MSDCAYKTSPVTDRVAECQTCVCGCTVTPHGFFRLCFPVG